MKFNNIDKYDDSLTIGFKLTKEENVYRIETFYANVSLGLVNLPLEGKLTTAYYINYSPYVTLHSLHKNEVPNPTNWSKATKIGWELMRSYFVEKFETENYDGKYEAFRVTYPYKHTPHIKALMEHPSEITDKDLELLEVKVEKIRRWDWDLKQK